MRAAAVAALGLALLGGCPGDSGARAGEPVAAAAETTAQPITMERVNRMDRAAFVATFGGIFEHSPWVAERAFAAQPFASAEVMHAAMMQAVRAASLDDKVQLLNAHPELAGKDARQKQMTANSVAEQGSAGLDRMSEADVARFDRLNAAYREKFGFPFIIAVRGRSRDEIVAAFERRLATTRDVEMEAELGQIEVITRMRLERVLGPFR